MPSLRPARGLRRPPADGAGIPEAWLARCGVDAAIQRWFALETGIGIGLFCCLHLACAASCLHVSLLLKLALMGCQGLFRPARVKGSHFFAATDKVDSGFAAGSMQVLLTLGSLFISCAPACRPGPALPVSFGITVQGDHDY